MFSKKIFCLQKILPRFIPKGTYVYVLIQDVQIQTLDKHFPVILLAIRQGSLDLKQLIPGNGPPNYLLFFHTKTNLALDK